MLKTPEPAHQTEAAPANLAEFGRSISESPKPAIHDSERLRTPGPAALSVPQPQEPVTPVVPDAPVTPAVPDPGTPGQPEEPARVPTPEEPATPVVPEPGPEEPRPGQGER